MCQRLFKPCRVWVAERVPIAMILSCAEEDLLKMCTTWMVLKFLSSTTFRRKGQAEALNVSFINDVQLTSSAFDSRYDNALAPTFVIKQRNGNPNKFGGNIRPAGSELATTFEGPLGKNTTFLASARRSYLQFLFQLLDLPIRPDYWDFQYKVNHRINNNTELNFIGLGAIDNFRLETPKNADADNAYILRANPLIKQWNYTVGASLKRLVDDGFYTIALSRNMFFNGAERYEDNSQKSGAKLFDLNSH